MSSFTPEQARAIQSDANLVVTAGAGAGKTRVLTERWLRLLMDPARRIDQVVAITFTEKAAAEMLERCRKELRKLARAAAPDGARARQLLEQLPEARISTFHSFCQSVLRLYPVEAGLDPEFQVADDMAAATLLTEAVEESLAAAAQSADAAVVDLFARFGRSRLAEHLERLIGQMRNLGENPPSLRQATLATAARLDNRDALAAPVCAAVEALLAYPTKPGSKGREQQEHLTETWARLQPQLPQGLQGEGAPALVAELRAMAEAINGNSVKPKAPLVEAIDGAEAALWTAEAARVGLSVLAMMEQALERYQARKDRLNLLDFADLIERLRRLLAESPAVRAEILAQNLIFLNDEVQDTDPSQWSVVRQMVLDPEEGGLRQGRLFIVGDAKQSIYRFRGARVDIFGNMSAEVAPAPENQVGLMKNFRSQGGLIRLVNSLFAQVMAPAGAGAVAYADMEWHREERERVAELLLAPSSGAEGRREEAALIAARIRELVDGGEQVIWEAPDGDQPEAPRGVQYRDVAILVQAMTHVRTYTQALAAAGVPYYVVAGDGFFQSPEVQDVANLLRVLDDPKDVAALAGWLRSPHIGLSDNAIVAMGLHAQGFCGAWNDAAWAAPAADAPLLDRARRLAPRLRQIAWQEPLPRVLPGLYAELNLFPVLLAQPDGQVAAANLEKLAAMAGQFAGQGRHQFPDLLRWLKVAMELEVREGVAATAEEGGNTVRILTVHKSKGLEFPVVILPDLGRSPRNDVPEVLMHPRVGLAPKLTDDEGEEVRSGLRDEAVDLDRQESEQEFRRLFYVAATRARDYLVFAASRPKVSASGEAKPRATWLHWLFEACGSDVAAPPAALTCGPVTFPVRTDLPQAGVLGPVEPEVAAVRLTPAKGQAAAPVPSAAVAELLRRTAPLAGGGPRTELETSASRLMLYQDCARKYYLQTVLGLPDLRRAPSGFEALAEEPSEAEDVAAESVLEPTVRGTIVHAVCERLTDPADLDLLIEQALGENGVVPGHPDVEPEIRQPLRRYVQSPLFQRIQAARKAESELPFRLGVAQMVVEGFIDKVLVEDDGAVVIDFKTNRAATAEQIADAAGHYLLQMQIYALAVQERFGLPVKDVILHFLTPDVSHSCMAQLDLDGVRAKLAALGAQLRTAAEWPEFPPAAAHCSHCQYQSFCGV